MNKNSQIAEDSRVMPFKPLIPGPASSTRSLPAVQKSLITRHSGGRTVKRVFGSLRAGLAPALATALALMVSSVANAGYLVQNATISHVYNTSGNQTEFALTAQGGSGPCSNGATIIFPVSAAPDADTHKRAYAAVLMALALGLHVSIYNYSGDACTGASYIDVSQ